jgi:general secretion pathway protein A
MECRRQLLIIVDEAHRLEGGLLRVLDHTMKTATDPLQRVSLVLVLQSRSENLATGRDVDEIIKKACLQCHLRALNAAETSEYIEYQLTAAGTGGNFFSLEAKHEIYKFSKGVPRLINSICDHALVIGYSKNCAFIEQSLIVEAAEDLRILR